MKVIGAGMPRTGTLTQKVALETLDFEPCYHWVNVIADLDQVDVWNRALDGAEPWDEVFGDSQATVDWPGGYFWRELMDFYPNAKVLLSVRDPEKWEPSFRETIVPLSHGESLIRLLASARGEIDAPWRRYLDLVDR
ncbi:MAG TPA: sulfotransferase, partial [Solirubrobacteraceae bacterium]|nr:sulfotransferase [Solirubrobacteraceae bacterium]